MSENPNIARAIIDKLGGIRQASRLMSHRNPTTVQGWCEKGLIPPKRKPELDAIAASVGVRIPKSLWSKMYGI